MIKRVIHDRPRVNINYFGYMFNVRVNGYLALNLAGCFPNRAYISWFERKPCPSKELSPAGPPIDRDWETYNRNS